jgi:predicted nuclease of predicted toxin-antitoxin system
MTFWLDAHLDPDLAAWLGSRFGVTAKPLREIGLRDADDDVLFDAARRFGGIVIVTKDADFADFVRRRGSPPQVLWLRCGNLSTVEMQLLLAREFPQALARLRAGEVLVEIT